jgi:NitT/TauT family transport system permease protein
MTRLSSAASSGVASVLRAFLPPLAVFVVITAGLEVVVRAGWIPAYQVAPPSAVLATLARDWSELFAAAATTAWSATRGFLLSAAIGIVAAILLSLHPLVRRAFFPYAVFLQTVPIIAIAPLLVIWLGDGPPTVIASAFLASLFPVIASTLVGLSSTEPPLRDMFKLYHASPWQTLVKLKIPSALPSMLTGLRVSAALAVIGAIVGEFVVYGGLGTMVTTASRQQRVDKIFAVLILAALLGVALTAAVNLLSRLLLRHWHASEAP